MQSNTRTVLTFTASLAFAILLGAAPAAANSCDDWEAEHAGWKARVLAQYVRGAPQAELDRSMFELLQREAYLTSCELPSAYARTALVGWRLVGRDRIDLAGAVVESVLDLGAFDVDVAGRFGIERERLSGLNPGLLRESLRGEGRHDAPSGSANWSHP